MVSAQERLESPGGHDVTVDRTKVDAALERVLEAQVALRDAALALQTQGLQAFSIWDDRFDSEARMHFIEAPQQALKQANARLSALSAWACEKAEH